MNYVSLCSSTHTHIHTRTHTQCWPDADLHRDSGKWSEVKALVFITFMFVCSVISWSGHQNHQLSCFHVLVPSCELHLNRRTEWVVTPQLTPSRSPNVINFDWMSLMRSTWCLLLVLRTTVCLKLLLLTTHEGPVCDQNHDQNHYDNLYNKVYKVCNVVLRQNWVKTSCGAGCTGSES